MRYLVYSVAAMLLAACDNAPEHYYAACTQQNGDGWNLIDTEKKDGYLISCTYQSPDKTENVVLRCSENGCD